MTLNGWQSCHTVNPLRSDNNGASERGDIPESIRSAPFAMSGQAVCSSVRGVVGMSISSGCGKPFSLDVFHSNAVRSALRTGADDVGMTGRSIEAGKKAEPPRIGEVVVGAPSSGVVDAKRERIGVAIGLKEEASESISLFLP